MIHVLILSVFSFNPVLQDSIGVETINGKLFVIHKVDEKETLFGISRRYRTTVDAILEFNAGAKDGLDIGEILKVPYTPKTVLRPSDGIVHKVAPKETLFSISRSYGVGMAELREWNKLPNDALSVGQELIIKKKGSSTSSTVRPPMVVRKGIHTVAEKETLFSITRQYNITEKQLREWNNIQGNELKIGQTLYVAQPEQGTSPVVKKQDSVTQKNNSVVTKKDPVVETVKQTEPVKQTESVKQETSSQVETAPIKISESIKNGSEVLESGIAELIEGTEGNRKYLALHRTAPLGTILKVRNEMNNREVFVRVMGKLPDTALTDKLIIKISKSAYDRLGAIDQRFRVEVTYYK
jgi:LysM repeat protein